MALYRHFSVKIMETAVFFYKQLKKTAVFQRPFKFYLLIFSHILLDMFQSVEKVLWDFFEFKLRQ